MARQSSRPADLDTQLKDIRRQMNDQLGCLDLRMDSKLSLLAEFQEFFKKRGEVEYEYARSLERLCEKFERSTKQRNLRNEVRSTFNLWSTVLAETRKLSRERASLAESMASEMVARLDIMTKDVHVLTKKCREICMEVQDHFLKELRDLGEQTKVYQHSYYNSQVAYNKWMKSKDKLDATRNATQRRKKAVEKEAENLRQYKAHCHLVMKNRNDLLLDISKCNSFSMQYFNMDVMDVIEYMDYDYHASFERLATAYKEAESEACETVMACAASVVDQAKGLNFENDLHYFLSENPGPFTPPNPFTFQPYEGDEVAEYKVNTQDVFERAKKTVESIQSNIQTLEIQREEDVKTVQHMEQVNLKKYRVTSVEDALAVLEEAGESLPGESGAPSRGSAASLDRGLAYQTRRGQAITLSQRGKKDALHFTLGVLQRRVNRSDKLALAHSQLDVLEKALDEQKVPPVPVAVDSSGLSVPGEVPKLFGGNVVEYLKATGSEIPLIVASCIRAIDKEGLTMEGLFRVPGPAAYTEELRKAFEEGRDPLLYVSKKVDIAAVASVLKGYFRELSIPLFPTQNYKDFINCTRHDDLASRLESIQNTLTLLDPAVVKVMRYLFKFLFRVSLFNSDNKMTSANLALVFGPTLTRAPPDVDPRQLHNDVPAVNMLIQLCIDHHLQVFGEEEDEEAAMMAPPPSTPPQESTMLPGETIVSPPLAPPSQPKEEEVPQSPAISPPPPPPVEVAVSPPPPPLPPHEPLSPAPDVVSSPPHSMADSSSEHKQETNRQPSAEQQESLSPNDEPPAEVAVAGGGSGGEGGGGEEGRGEELEKKGLKEQTSGVSLSGEWSALDEQVKGIQASLEQIHNEDGGEGGPVEGGEEKAVHGSESESESEDEEEEEEVMSVSARALYDYTARSDKELSFKRGDTLKVIEKSPDGHWWDGLCGSSRGFIPVAYVEIIELQTATTSIQQMSVPPQAPTRRSSMQDRKEEGAEPVDAQVSEAPTESSIAELKEPVANSRETSRSPEPPTVTLTHEDEAGEKATKVEGEREEPRISSPVPQADIPKDPAHKPPVPITSGSVKLLTDKFRAPPPPQQVLVQPHRRHPDLSPKKSYDPPHTPASADPEVISRSSSASSSGRVTQLTAQFKPTPPPTKPRPPSHIVSPGADRSAASFHITPHSSTTGSPLQQAQLGSQLTPKPASGKTTPSKPRVPSVRKDKNPKKEERPPLPSKPLTKPPPPKGPNELRAELQAVVGKRRPTDQ